MKKTFLLAYSLLLFAGVKAQQTKIRNTGVIEHREGSSPELKAKQSQVKNQTQAFPKPLDSARSVTKTRAAIGSQVVQRPSLDSLKVNRTPTTDKAAAATTQFIKGKVSTKKPQQTTTNKSAAQQAAKQSD